MSAVLQAVFEPGFFTSTPVRVALLIGGMAALVSGVVGTFAVVRGQSYAGHALADISVTGGSGSYLAGVCPLWGFAAVGVAAAAAMDAHRGPAARVAGTSRPASCAGRGWAWRHCSCTWDTTSTSTTGATVTILFGSIFTISGSTAGAAALLGAVALAIVAVLYRPLLLSSVSAGAGRRPRRTGAHRRGAVPGGSLALAVSLSAADHRGHPEHRAAGRAGRGGAAADQQARAGGRSGRR